MVNPQILTNNPFLKYQQKQDTKNPFQGTLAEAVRYDYINACLPLDLIVDFKTEVLPVYEYAASFVVNALQRELPESSSQNLLDLGCGTGASTRMLAQEYPQAKITAIDQSKNMLKVAGHKFGLSDAKSFEQEAELIFGGEIPAALKQYWEDCRSSNYSSGKIELVEKDLKDISTLVAQEFDGAMANHSLHWLNKQLPSFFQDLKPFLKDTAALVWNTASDFFDDETFPSEKYAYRYHKIFGQASEILEKKGYLVKDYLQQRLPKWKLKDIQEMSREGGFETKQMGRILLRQDFNRFCGFYFPVTIGGIIVNPIEPEELGLLSREVLAEVIKRNDFLQDLNHVYDINPIFVSRKLK